jgi:hypothetical protein
MSNPTFPHINTGTSGSQTGRLSQLQLGVGNNQFTRASDINPLIDEVNNHETRITAIEGGTVTLIDVEVGNGTAAAPSVTFTSDNTTGIYLINPSTHDIGITTNGVLAFDISATTVTSALPIAVTSATDSTSGSTGSIHTAGGLGVTKAIFGGSTITGTTSVLTPGVDAISAGALTIGTATATSVVVTPATTVTGALTATGGVLVTAIDKAAAGTITIGASTATAVTVTPATTFNSSVATDTVLNKTANGGTSIKRPVIASTAYASPTVLTATQSGALCLMDRIAGCVYTLPAATAANTGVYFEFVQTATVTSNASTIQGATSSDLFIAGSSIFQTKATTDGVYYSPNGFSNYQITQDGSTKGGIIGAWYRVTCTGLNAWHVTGFQSGTGVVATPFAG